MGLASLFLAVAFTRLWEPAGGVELTRSPGPRWDSLNEDKPAYSVLGPLADAWAEGIAHDPARPATPELARYDRCSFRGVHFSTAKYAHEAHAWVWSSQGLHWEARGPAQRYNELVQWAYAGAFHQRCEERGDSSRKLPAKFFR